MLSPNGNISSLEISRSRSIPFVPRFYASSCDLSSSVVLCQRYRVDARLCHFYWHSHKVHKWKRQFFSLKRIKNLIKGALWTSMERPSALESHNFIENLRPMRKGRFSFRSFPFFSLSLTHEKGRQNFEWKFSQKSSKRLALSFTRPLSGQNSVKIFIAGRSKDAKKNVKKIIKKVSQKREREKEKTRRWWCQCVRVNCTRSGVMLLERSTTKKHNEINDWRLTKSGDERNFSVFSSRSQRKKKFMKVFFAWTGKWKKLLDFMPFFALFWCEMRNIERTNDYWERFLS